MCLCACGGGDKVVTSGEHSETDTVSMAKISTCDSAVFTVVEGEACVIKANVELSYPMTYVNKEKTEELQDLYATEVLDIPSDTASLASAFLYFVEKVINRYKDTDENLRKEDLEADYEAMKQCDIDVKTYALYNNAGLLSLCKAENVVINGELPVLLHYYYTYDLEKMKRMSYTDLCGEENATELGELLKEKLRKDMGVNNDDDLVDMGYYNIDNLVANDNFYVTNDSVVWSYLPRELSVFDEVRISLARESVINLKEKNKK